jgi:type IV secretion system protein VirD4
MKFKVDPKDFYLFVLYCLILLYLCALFVANLFSLVNTGTFYGLIPISAFTLQYLPITLSIFFGAIILIFTSVSSYIFDRQKGSGFLGLLIKDKTGDGYSRWATEKEIKNSSHVERINPTSKVLSAAGIPLINKGKEVWVDDGSYHNLVIGSTGSGKSESLVFPMVNILAKKGESMIITDPKGEIYRKTSKNLEDRGYKIIILNFREPSKGNSWNPLYLPFQYYREGNKDKSIELLNDVALNILYDPSNKSDSDFWEKGAADYFAGLSLGLFQDAKEEEVNLNSINYMSTVGEERYSTSTYIKEYFNLKGPESNAYMFASTTINAPSDTKGGLLSTFRQKIRAFSTQENLSEMLSYSNFDMREIGKGKTAIYMIIHDEKKTYHPLMTIFIKQCYEALIDSAQQNGGKLPFRTNFILDEFQNMPPLKDVDSMVSAARSRDIRFTFIIQNFAALNDIYGEEIAQVIKGNCGNLIYLISTELKALEEISKMCGEVKSKEKDKTASTPLITVSDLQKLKLGEAIILRLRMNPFRTKYVPNLKMDWGEDYPENGYPQREVRKVQLFDLKKYVTEEKRKNMMAAPGGDSPLETPNNMNPFMMNGGGFNEPRTGVGMNPSPFNSPLQGMDIDAMMKDIDAKLKELDEEEKAQKEKLKNQNKELVDEELPLLTDEKDTVMDEKEPVVVNKPVNKITNIEPVEMLDEKPKVNVDVDSVIVNENVITDDEFFDDFFGDE